MSHVLSDAWTWDMWFADDGDCYHAFYLKPSRTLGNPDRRHFYVTAGPGQSPNALRPGSGEAAAEPQRRGLKGCFTFNSTPVGRARHEWRIPVLARSWILTCAGDTSRGSGSPQDLRPGGYACFGA